MKKMIKKLFLEVILCWVLFFFIGCNQDINSSETATSDLSEETGISSEVQLGGVTSLEQNILYYCEESVLDNPLFEQFLCNEITAYDNIKDSADNFGGDKLVDFYEEEFYVRDLYQAYYDVYAEDVIGVQIRDKDLNQDGQKELIILIEYGEEDGSLHTFSEADGKLYAWECWQGIFANRTYINLYENGTFACWGEGGGIQAGYNEEGYLELVYLCKLKREYIDADDTEKFILYHEITLYEDGEVQKEFFFKEYYGIGDEPEMMPEDKEVEDEYYKIVPQLHEENGEIEYVNDLKYIEDAQTIKMKQLIGGEAEM